LWRVTTCELADRYLDSKDGDSILLQKVDIYPQNLKTLKPQKTSNILTAVENLKSQIEGKVYPSALITVI
jgi:hypothetical protein